MCFVCRGVVFPKYAARFTALAKIASPYPVSYTNAFCRELPTAHADRYVAAAATLHTIRLGHLGNTAGGVLTPGLQRGSDYGPGDQQQLQPASG